MIFVLQLLMFSESVMIVFGYGLRVILIDGSLQKIMNSCISIGVLWIIEMQKCVIFEMIGCMEICIRVILMVMMSLRMNEISVSGIVVVRFVQVIGLSELKNSCQGFFIDYCVMFLLKYLLLIFVRVLLVCSLLSVLLMVFISVFLFFVNMNVCLLVLFVLVVIFRLDGLFVVLQLRNVSLLLIVVLMWFWCSSLIVCVQFLIFLIFVLDLVVSLYQLFVSDWVVVLFLRLLKDEIELLFLGMMIMLGEMVQGLLKRYFVLCLLLIEIWFVMMLKWLVLRFVKIVFYCVFWNFILRLSLLVIVWMILILKLVRLLELLLLWKLKGWQVFLVVMVSVLFCIRLKLDFLFVLFDVFVGVFDLLQVVSMVVVMMSVVVVMR